VDDTTPSVTERSSPNGCPIAIAGSPGRTPRESPSGSGAERADPQQRQVGRRIAADDARVDAPVVLAEAHRHLRAARGDVVVRHDQAVAVDQEAGAGGDAVVAARRTGRDRHAARPRVDPDDAPLGAFEDLAHGRGSGCAHCGGGGGAGIVVVADAGAQDQPADGDGGDQAGDHGDERSPHPSHGRQPCVSSG
jgi:hypothetical protein